MGALLVCFCGQVLRLTEHDRLLTVLQAHLVQQHHLRVTAAEVQRAYLPLMRVGSDAGRAEQA